MSRGAQPLPPVRKQVVVRCRLELAFEVFTARIGEWWPLETFSVGGSAATGVTFEPGEGGRIYETSAAGAEHPWGVVTRWDPPHGFECRWHPDRAAIQAQTLSVLFERVEEGTRVTLEHRGWEALADEAAAVRGRYDGGWELVFVECFVAAAESAAGSPP